MDLIFTSDDAGGTRTPEAVEQFELVAAWLEARGLRATWFWVPKAGGRPGHEDPDWVPALRAARARGHDIQLHGLVHGSCLEFGVPPPSTRRANPVSFAEYEAEPERWQKEHSLDRLESKLREGVALYRMAFEEEPLVFRAPCFGMCPAAYEALARVGIHHSSSRSINPIATAHALLGDPALRRWEPDVPCHPYIVPPGVTEYPCVEDLAIFGVREDQIEDRLDLYREEVSRTVAEAGDEGVLVLNTHFQAMARHWHQARELFGRLLDWLPTQGVARCLTFADYLREQT